MFNQYIYRWIHRANILTPLSNLTSENKTFMWTVQAQEAFENIKRIFSRETLLAFPNFTKPFHIYSDTRKKQLGAVITQEGKPIAFFS